MHSHHELNGSIKLFFTDAKIDNHVGLIINENENDKEILAEICYQINQIESELSCENIFFLSLESDKYLVIWGKVLL